MTSATRSISDVLLLVVVGCRIGVGCTDVSIVGVVVSMDIVLVVVSWLVGGGVAAYAAAPSEVVTSIAVRVASGWSPPIRLGNWFSTIVAAVAIRSTKRMPITILRPLPCRSGVSACGDTGGVRRRLCSPGMVATRAGLVTCDTPSGVLPDGMDVW